MGSSISIAAPPLLSSLELLKQLLGVSPEETTDDGKLLALLQGASAAIVREAKQTFQPAVITGELRDGDGSPLLELATTPILSVEALAINGEAIDVSEVKVYPGWIRFEETDEYNPRLRGSSRVFPRGNQNISVDYTAGFAAVPFDVAMECAVQAVFIQNTLAKAGVTAETSSVANNSTTYAQVPLAPSVQRMCNRYRPQRIAIV